MSLKDELNAGVLDLFVELQSLTKSVTYKELTSESPAPGGSVARVYVDHAISVLLTDFTTEERDSGLVRNDDLKVLIAAPGLGFKPKPKDQIIFSDGSVFYVTAPVSVDPSESLYTLTARR